MARINFRSSTEKEHHELVLELKALTLFYPEDRQKIDQSHKKITTISVNNKL